MKKILGLFLFSLLLTACKCPCGLIHIGTVPVTETPTQQQPCYFNWATQPLPDLSTQVQTAMETAGLSDVTVRAEAFGENCYDAQTNEAVSFGALETDFHIVVKVAGLADRNGLGNMLEKILVVMDAFPEEATPGPQPGSIGVSFQAGSAELNLQFTAAEGKSTREAGLTGAALLDKLQSK